MSNLSKEEAGHALHPYVERNGAYLRVIPGLLAIAGSA